MASSAQTGHRRLPEPVPGDPVRAALIADIIREIGDGRDAQRESIQQAIIAALVAGGTDWIIQARIGAVYPADAADPAPPGAYRASEVFYDVYGVGTAGLKLLHVQPTYGRPVRDQSHRIYAARVGMVCCVVRYMRPNSDRTDSVVRSSLMLLPDSEVRATKVCGA